MTDFPQAMVRNIIFLTHKYAVPASEKGPKTPFVANTNEDLRKRVDELDSKVDKLQQVRYLNLLTVDWIFAIQTC